MDPEPSFGDAHLRLVKLYTSKGEMNKAKEHLQRILELDPGNITAKSMLEEL
jgi:hypothetical protein